MAERKIKLNGHPVRADYQSTGTGTEEQSEPLLYWLRDTLGVRGPKFGCGIAQCGACTVLVDGAITRSCVRQVHAVADQAEVRTLDGLQGRGNRPHPLQRAFVALQAGQCGFCLNGMVMGALGWLEARLAAGNRAVPSEDEVEQFLSGASATGPQNYLCRCGTHTRIVAAIRSAAEELVR
ncbi:(2Fe-2S)-binding protein [Amycolatopsis sp. NBC_00438]|uniref:(2Fe-2S)-binding protein n=1 Tax=Amycolatopsis sp. NBC_00438 TaxID=2903558 RepID=UPI002E1BB5B9